MKNKGFTLIELLAVIVILAIIALIATPIIIGIINNTREESYKRSIDLYGKAVVNGIGQYQLNNSGSKVVGQYTSDSLVAEGINISYSGVEVKCDTIEIYESGSVYITGCKVGNSGYIDYTYGKKETESSGTEGDAFTGTIYRNSNELISIGETIVPGTKNVWCEVNEDEEYNSCIDENWGWELNEEYDCLDDINGWEGATCEQGTVTTGLSNYEMSSSNISEDYYLKHDVLNNIVTVSYVCIRYTDGVQKEACLRGGDGGASYGTYTGISSTMVYDVSNLNPTGNIALIEGTRNYFEGNKGSCIFNDSNSHCSYSAFNLNAWAVGQVDVGFAFFGSTCYVNDDGSSHC